MVIAPVALVAEKKCISWCMDKLTPTPSVLSMVSDAISWAHVTATVGHAQRAAAVAHNRLLSPFLAPVLKTLLMVMPQLLPRMHEAGTPSPIVLKPHTPRESLSSPRLTVSLLVPRLLPMPRLMSLIVSKLLALTVSPLLVLRPVTPLVSL
jgi:hypothetical protein